MTACSAQGPAAPPASARTAGPLPVDGAACRKTCASSNEGFSKPCSRRRSSASPTARAAAICAPSEGSDGRAMRLARLHTAVVMRAFPRSCLLGASMARRIASSGIRPRLGEAEGVATGEGISSGIKLGDTGRKWLSGAPRSFPKLGDWRPILAAGSLSTSDGLTTVRVRRVSMLQSSCLKVEDPPQKVSEVTDSPGGRKRVPGASRPLPSDKPLLYEPSPHILNTKALLLRFDETCPFMEMCWCEQLV